MTVVAECLDILGFKAQIKGLRLVFDPALGREEDREEAERRYIVRCDGYRIKQILINLLSNAVKYTQAGKVEVELRLKGRRRRISLSVRDTGVGIEPERLEGLFSAFTKIMRHRELNIEGVGLGLTISKTLAQAMGGDLSAQSDINKGSVFTLTLPYRPFYPETDSLFDRSLNPMGSSSEDEGSDRISSNEDNLPITAMLNTAYNPINTV